MLSCLFGLFFLFLFEGDVSKIFSNAEEILAFNENFLRDLAGLDGGFATGNSGGGGGGKKLTIGATLRRQPLDMFKPYSVYVTQYPQAIKRCGEMFFVVSVEAA